MIGAQFIKKLRNLTEILLLPGGLRLKLRHRNFYWKDYRLNLRLKASGVAPACIFDVGANEGQFAIGALAAFPGARIISYEPGVGSFARLTQSLANHSGVELINKAVGSNVGGAVLHVTNVDQASSLLELGRGHLEAYPEIRETGRESVIVTTIEEEFRRITPIGPILLKIDTQGYEMHVLRGAGHALESIRWIVLETASQPMYQGEVVFDEIAAWLRERGFAFCGPVELHVNSAGRPLQFDALFERHGTGQLLRESSS